MEIAEAIGKLTEAVKAIPDPQGAIWLSIGADVAVICTALFLLYQLRHSVLVKEERKVRAHERIAQWNDPHFAERRQGVFRFLRDPNNSPQAQIDKFRSDDQWRSVVVEMLNFFEALGQAIDDDVVDEGSAKKFFDGILDRFYKSVLPIIEAFQKLDADSLNDIVSLAHRWGDPASG